ncbi:PPA1309 family protein [Brachybacterium sp. YJGR34]|uniref:PPA1309 family protein n=1 Tax=Brachybacterium sp. YJGR34 TaxID=2059911 RepID=UPI000E0AC2A1|nr:PPA1309 family protein [Brachybacterium sp. YJGR34]
MTTPAPDPLDAPTAALAAAVLEVARHLEDTPLAAPQLFALARSAELLAASPALAAMLGAETEGAATGDDLHLTPIDLGEASESGADVAVDDPLVALETVQWPDLAAGGAVACDLPASAWSVRDDDPAAGLPTGQPLRVVVAALADGTTWSAVHRGGEDGYVLGAALLPDISAALVETLQPTG